MNQEADHVGGSYLSRKDINELREAAAEMLRRRTGGRGLYHKYIITRTDGRHIPWAFVIEEDDPLAPVILLAYAQAAREAGHTALAEDLETKVASIQARRFQRADRH